MRILRFDFSSRVLHWSHSIVFIWLLITGIWIFLTPKSLLGDPLPRMMHRYASLLFVFLPAIIYIFGGRSVRKDVKDMMSMYVGKFNDAKTTHLIATVILITGLSVSGFVVWGKSIFSVSFVELNFQIHDFLTIISILMLTVHIIFTLVTEMFLKFKNKVG